MTSPQIEITPNKALVDQRVNIRLSGFAPNTRVTLKAQMPDDLPQMWRSQAAFKTDAQGAVDLSAQAPLSGSYDTADPMGMIWSMTPEKEGLMFIQTALTPVAVEFTAEVDGGVAAAATLERIRLAEGVTRVEVRDNGLRGSFFLPAGDGPFPAVVLVSGSGGGLSEGRGALFAAHGIAAFSLAYFAYEDLPKGLVDIPLEYFETAIQWLQAHPRVNRDKLAISGASRGGELSLLLGATFPQFKAVIAYVPSGLVWGGFNAEGEFGKPAWTYRGQGIPFVQAPPSPEITAQFEDMAKNGVPIPLTPSFNHNIDHSTNLETAFIPVDKTNGPILMISGEEDAMWPGTRMSEMVVDWLNQHHFPHPYQHVSYPDAGHMILAPYIPSTVLYSKHPVNGGLYAYGGTPKGNAHAMADSWARVLDFVGKYLLR